MPAAAGKRNPKIDCLKGCLILFVITGHLLTGPIRESFPRYLIYAFHMPLFIALSGYLCRPDRLLFSSFSDLLKKYWPRVLLPWLIAVQIYWITNHAGKVVTIHDYLSAYWDIYFHLWYIPGFLCYIFLSWLILKLLRRAGQTLQDSMRFLLAVSAAVSLLFCIWYLLPLGEAGRAARIQYLVYHDFHLLYWIYFTIGMYFSGIGRTTGFFPDASGLVRHTKSGAEKRYPRAFLLAGVLFCTSLYLFLYFYEYAWLEHCVKFCLNLFLISCLFSGFSIPSAHTGSIWYRRLAFLGKHSLAFYLYVQAGKAVTARFLTFRKMPAAYTITELLLSLAVFLLLIYLLKIPFFRSVFFGEPQKKKKSVSNI